MTITYGRWENPDTMIAHLELDGFKGIDEAEPSVIRFHSCLDGRYRGGTARRYGDGNGTHWIFEAKRDPHPGQACESSC